MSFRTKVLSDIEHDREMRERHDVLLAAKGTFDSVNSDDMNSVFYNNPLRDRKGYYAHFKPNSLAITLLKHVAVQSLDLVQLENDKLPPLPLADDYLGWIKFMLRRSTIPIIKDLSTTSLHRYLEHTAEKYIAKDDKKIAGKFIRGR